MTPHSLSVELEEQLTEAIAARLECTYGDAAGIVEANEGLIGSFLPGTSPEEMADTIIGLFGNL
jgi:hypothetical protein